MKADNSHSPKDFMTPAQSCAKEIEEEFGNLLTIEDENRAHLVSILERLLSSEVASVHAEYQKLAEKWKSLPYGLGGGYRAACASEVEALAPNKEGQK